MKRLILFLIVALCTLGSIFANTASVVEIAGKVEYQIPGNDWRPARVGDVLPKGTLISTGFKSTALLKIGNATITVKPITRLSLEEIIQSESTSNTQLFLQAGRVSAEVTPQAGLSTEFSVKSPTATASVRGTELDTDGRNVYVSHGKVLVTNNTGTSITVKGGEFAAVTKTGKFLPVIPVVGTGTDLSEAYREAETETRASTPPVTVGDITVDDGDISMEIQLDWQ
jgi:hypothetical protein